MSSNYDDLDTPQLANSILETNEEEPAPKTFVDKAKAAGRLNEKVKILADRVSENHSLLDRKEVVFALMKGRNRKRERHRKNEAYIWRARY